MRIADYTYGLPIRQELSPCVYQTSTVTHGQDCNEEPQNFKGEQVGSESETYRQRCCKCDEKQDESSSADHVAERRQKQNSDGVSALQQSRHSGDVIVLYAPFIGQYR